MKKKIILEPLIVVCLHFFLLLLKYIIIVIRLLWNIFTFRDLEQETNCVWRVDCSSYLCVPIL